MNLHKLEKNDPFLVCYVVPNAHITVGLMCLPMFTIRPFFTDKEPRVNSSYMFVNIFPPRMQLDPMQYSTKFPKTFLNACLKTNDHHGEQWLGSNATKPLPPFPRRGDKPPPYLMCNKSSAIGRMFSDQNHSK